MFRRPLLALALAFLLLPGTALLAASAEPGRDGDPFVDVDGDTMTGDLDLGSHALVLGGAPLHSPAAGTLRFGDAEVCLVATCAPATTLDWSALTGVPTGFADGVDAVDGGIAVGLSCAACVGEALLGFDPATQLELDDERSQRGSADAALDARVATLEGASFNGTATDLSCTQCVDAEELAFKAATVKALDDETAAREAADAALQARVAALEAAIVAAGGEAPEGYVLLDVDNRGTFYGPLPFYGGCRKEGTVSTTMDGSGRTMTQVSSVEIVPCRIGVGPGMTSFFFTWLGDALGGVHMPVDLTLVPITGKGVATQPLLVDEARITGMRLPRLAAGGSAWLEVEMAPWDIQKGPADACCPAATPVKPITSFEFSTSGGALDLVAVGPLAMSAPAPFTSGPEWSDFQLRARATNASTMSALETWLQATLGSGVEHDAQLQVRDATGTSQTLRLLDVGLFRRADLFAGADGGVGFDAYAESGELL